MEGVNQSHDKLKTTVRKAAEVAEVRAKVAALHVRGARANGTRKSSTGTFSVKFGQSAIILSRFQSRQCL